MTTRAEVVAEARKWVGTKFMHQQSQRGVGTDCVGLIRGVSLELGLRADLTPAEIDRANVYLSGYPLYAHSGIFRKACNEFLVPISKASIQIGDLVLMSFVNGEPQHLGIVCDYPHGGFSVVHALGPQAPNKVIEHRLDDRWFGRIVEAYSFRAFRGVE